MCAVFFIYLFRDCEFQAPIYQKHDCGGEKINENMCSIRQTRLSLSSIYSKILLFRNMFLKSYEILIFIRKTLLMHQ